MVPYLSQIKVGSKYKFVVLLIFSSPRFGDIRTAGTAENPLFCLADLCRVLELQVTPTKNRLDPRGVNLIKVSKPVMGYRVLRYIIQIRQIMI